MQPAWLALPLLSPAMPPIEDSPSRRTARLLGVGARTLGRSLLRQIPGGDRAQRKVDYWTAVGRDWAQTLGELRGAAMKLGQLASQYADVLPPQLAEQLRRLQNAAEPIPFVDFERALATQWSAEQFSRIACIEPEALAAASIGQVHRAQHVDGRALVIKLRYPGVGEAVDADLKQLRRLIGASKLLPLDGTAMDRLMDEVRQRFRDETDYAAELGYLQLLRSQAAVAGIVYPQPILELCTEGVIVSSEERGASLEVARTWPQAQRDRVGRQLATWLVHQLFETHAVHADPHPGNFAFRDNDDVVVYDFGCIKRVPDPVVEKVRMLLAASAARDWAGVHDMLGQLGGLAGEVPLKDVEAVYRDLHRLIIQPLAQVNGFDFSNPSFIEDLRACARSHIGLTFRFKPVTDLIFVIRALSGHYWLLRALGAHVDVRGIMEQHGIRLT